jgi:hypothetical protein
VFVEKTNGLPRVLIVPRHAAKCDLRTEQRKVYGRVGRAARRTAYVLYVYYRHGTFGAKPGAAAVIETVGHQVACNKHAKFGKPGYELMEHTIQVFIYE